MGEQVACQDAFPHARPENLHVNGAGKALRKKHVPARPPFDQLPLQPQHPKGSSWGLWGDDDELGSLNLLTPEVIQRAASEIQTGRSIPMK